MANKVRIGSVKSQKDVPAFCAKAVADATTELALGELRITSTTLVPYVEDDGTDALFVVVVVDKNV